MVEAQPQSFRSVTVNGIEYKWDDLSEEARQQAINLHGADREIERLRQQLAICQTARNAYAQALQQALGKKNMQ